MLFFFYFIFVSCSFCFNTRYRKCVFGKKTLLFRVHFTHCLCTPIRPECDARSVRTDKRAFPVRYTFFTTNEKKKFASTYKVKLIQSSIQNAVSAKALSFLFFFFSLLFRACGKSFWSLISVCFMYPLQGERLPKTLTQSSLVCGAFDLKFRSDCFPL